MLENNNMRLVQISDLHIALKIFKTLPLIEQYQKNELPKTKPLEGYKESQKTVLNTLDSLTKK